MKLEPDISWWENGRCTFVGDAKYKPASGGDARSADLYQVLAYAVAAPAAKHATCLRRRRCNADEDAGAVYRLVDGRCVEQVVLDLRGETTELLDRVTTLAAKVREHRARPSGSGLRAAMRPSDGGARSHVEVQDSSDQRAVAHTEKPNVG